MYLPAHFEEKDPRTLHALMRAHPLATIVTLDRSGAIVANHIPLLLRADGGGLGALHGHVARANPLWSDLAQGFEALAIFQGAGGYISPSWYASKKEHGKVVPTWNYCTVHAYGPLQVHDDAAWVRPQVEALTAGQEAAMPRPWAVTDAPEAFVESMLRNIVGIEIPIARLSGKWKMSQNQP